MLPKERLWTGWFTVILYVSLYLAAAAVTAADNYNYKIQYYDVPLDHFSFASNKTFKIRYVKLDN